MKAGGDVALLVLVALASSACRGKHSSHNSTPLALPLGIYQVSPPHCSSTDASPVYPAVQYQVALFDFSDLKAHTLEISAHDAVETFASDACTMTVRRSLAQNAGNTFAMARDRTFTWAPADCTLTVTFDDVPRPVGKNYSALFQDSTDHAEELPFDVTATAGTYTLTSADRPELIGPFEAYGCAKTDHLLLRLTPASNRPDP